MKSKQAYLRQWLLPVIIIICAFLFQLTGKSGYEYLCYNREQIFAGQWWRLFTGHVLHISWLHFLMNTLGLVLIQLLFFPMFSSPFRLLLLILLSMSGIDFGLILFNPDIKWYVGFSGVLHGMIAAGSLMLIYRHGIKNAGLLILLILKLLWEQFIGPVPGSEDWTGAAVITDAHLYGAISGGLFVSLFKKHLISDTLKLHP